MLENKTFENETIGRCTPGTSYHKMKNCKIKQDLQLSGDEEVIKRRHIKFFDNLRKYGNPLFTELTPPPPPSRWQDSKSAEKLVDLTWVE